MKRNMHGFIEPYTLGFLLSLIGAGMTFIGNQQDEQAQDETPTEQSQTITSKALTTLEPSKTAVAEHESAK